jgi:hypothetical protein
VVFDYDGDRVHVVVIQWRDGLVVRKTSYDAAPSTRLPDGEWGQHVPRSVSSCPPVVAP